MIKKYIILLFSLVLFSSVIFAAGVSVSDIPVILKFKGEIENPGNLTFQNATIFINGDNSGNSNDYDVFKDGFYTDALSASMLNRTEPFFAVKIKVTVTSTTEETPEVLDFDFNVPNPNYSQLSDVSYNDIKDNSIDTSHIINNELNSYKILTQTITSEKLVDSAITNDNISENTISNEKISNNTITEDHIKDNVITPNKLASESNDEIDGVVGLSSSNNLIYKAQTFNDPTIIAARGLSLSNDTLSISNLGVKSDYIKTSQITTPKLFNNSVTSVKIADNAVTTEKINNFAVTTDKIANSAVITSKIKDNNVSIDKFNDAIIKSTYCTPKLDLGLIYEGSHFISESLSLPITTCNVNRDNDGYILVTYEVDSTMSLARYGNTSLYVTDNLNNYNLSSRWFCEKLGGYLESTTYEDSINNAFYIHYDLSDAINKYFTITSVNSSLSGPIDTITCKFDGGLDN